MAEHEEKKDYISVKEEIETQNKERVVLVKDNEEFDEEAFIGGIEFAIDTNQEISEGDYALYQYLVQKRAERQQVEEAVDELRERGGIICLRM